MAARGRSINIDLAKYKPGLVFDADGITLLGKYTDELAAHRAKKRWVDVLGSYFLLERDRDYDLWVNGSLDDRCFVLSCSFVSACGRYAFWRLVNRQAPEAEDKLRGETPPDTFTSMWADIAKEEEKESWAADAIERQIADNEETRNLIAKIMRLFR